MRGLAVIAAKLGSRTNPLALSFAVPLLSTFITSRASCRGQQKGSRSRPDRPSAGPVAEPAFVGER
jgi:hypothetical protein